MFYDDFLRSLSMKDLLAHVDASIVLHELCGVRDAGSILMRIHIACELANRTCSEFQNIHNVRPNSVAP